jgi:trans-aconitate methyltransferase
MSDHKHHHHHNHTPGGYKRHHHDHPTGGQDWGELGAQLELQAEILSPILDEAVCWLRDRASTDALLVGRIIDIGCGPGVSTTTLASVFPEANVLALDQSPELLAMVRARAERHGLTQRITTVPVNLEEGLGIEPPIELAWAGMVLHHLADPVGFLRKLYAGLRPGGLLAFTEFGPANRTLPDELGFGVPDFERRYSDAVRAAIEAHLAVGATHIDWAATLSEAGFEVLVQRTVLVDLGAPLQEWVRRWIAKDFARTAPMIHDKLSAEDQATLAILLDVIDPRGLTHRADLELHAGRALYIARKPKG